MAAAIGPRAPYDNPHWRDLYLQALAETNRTKVPERISRAEKALADREREIREDGEDPDELGLISKAFGTLHALRLFLGP